eukprot:5996447-Prymnesium_polylepis.1
MRDRLDGEAEPDDREWGESEPKLLLPAAIGGSALIAPDDKPIGRGGTINSSFKALIRGEFTEALPSRSATAEACLERGAR